MKEDLVDQYHSDDFAGMKAGKFFFYYGYEDEDPETGEWRFSVEENDKEVFLATTSQIDKECDNTQLRMPQNYLVAGIGMWLKEKQSKKSRKKRLRML